jgi:hypothetical protein
MFVRWRRQISRAKQHQWRYEYLDGKIVKAIRVPDAEKPYKLSAYLVRSQRINGKPKHQVLAFLGSLESEHLAEKKPAWWVRVGQNLTPLNLDEYSTEQIFQALAQKTPRPTEEEMIVARKKDAAFEAYINKTLSHVGSDAPPLVRPECGTTEKEIEDQSGLKFQWDKRGPYRNPMTGETTRERRYYLALTQRLNTGKYTVVTKLGYVRATDLKKSLYGGWEEFWFKTHAALILANVERDTYDLAMRLIGCHVSPPDDMATLVQEQQEKADKRAFDLWSAAIDEVHRRGKEREQLRRVQEKNADYLSSKSGVPH